MAVVGVLVVVVLVLGLALHNEGLVIAAFLGVPLGLVLTRLWARVDALEEQLAALRLGLGAARSVGDTSRTLGVAQSVGGRDARAPGEAFELPDQDLDSESALMQMAEADRSAPEPAGQAILDAALAAVRGFFTDGNLVVRVGILILFLGVAFLLKYAAEHTLVPLSLRLGGVAVGGLVLLGIGWRLRHSRRLYALLLQGAGVGVIFLTAFAAVRLFGVLEPLPALVVMVVLVAATGALAVVQDAPGLAGFGVAGGFLAPILVSTGSGSHVALFTYYALLNLGILVMAWFKAWKLLNLEGFVFTFGVGTLWGARYYGPEFFASVEPFLALDFALYLGIAILFALRQPPRLKGLVDGTLVFGLPLAVFALQGALVADTEYGLAWTALGLGLIYLLAAGTLYRLGNAGLRLLVDAFLALGAAFLTIAIPLALDGHWTSALWAAEGAALVWVGVRQARVLARLAGLGLQLAAGVAFVAAGHAGTGSLPVLNGDGLGYLILACAGLFSSIYLERSAAALLRAEAPLTWVALAWGGLWWLALGVHETDRFLDDPAGYTAFLLFLAVSGLALGLIARRLGWVGLGLAGLALLPLLWAMGWVDWVFELHPHPLAGWNGQAWVLALGVQGWLLFRFADAWPGQVLRLWHGAWLWLLVLLLGVDLGWWARHLLAGEAWEWVGWALPAVLAMAALVLAWERLPWPVLAYPEDYRGHHLVPIALALWAWALLGTLTPADALPLPFVPVLNPLGLTQLAVLGLLWRWSRSGPAAGWGLAPGIGFVGLAVLTGWVAQGVHHLGGIPYDADALFDSTLFQASLSMVWGLTALAAMWFGNRRAERPVWISGALLLGLVVAKLFVADLAGTGSVARIVSFIGVGAMMLAVGYLAPLPPRPAGEGAKVR
jgi:uncharacterized membrane protein